MRWNASAAQSRRAVWRAGIATYREPPDGAIVSFPSPRLTLTSEYGPLRRGRGWVVPSHRCA